MSLPTPDTRLADLEHLDWTPGCDDEDCMSAADGVDSCRMCHRGVTLLCDPHHMQFIADIAESLAAEACLTCLACGAELHSTADRDWRPL